MKSTDFGQKGTGFSPYIGRRPIDQGFSRRENSISIRPTTLNGVIFLGAFSAPCLGIPGRAALQVHPRQQPRVARMRAEIVVKVPNFQSGNDDLSLFHGLFEKISGGVHLAQRHMDRGKGIGDGSRYFLVEEKMLLDMTVELNAVLVDQLKTNILQDYRCMTTWVLRKRRG